MTTIEWAQREQVWIIENDSEFHYAGKPKACVQGLDTHERTIYLGAFIAPAASDFAQTT